MLHSTTNIVNATNYYLNKLGVSVTKRFLKEQLETNPYYPSLYCISDVLDKLNVKNAAAKITNEKLSELNFPVIAYIGNLSTGKDFVVVTFASDTNVKYVFDNKEKITERSKFEEDWENIVLIAEPTNESGDPDYIQNRKKERSEAGKRLSLWAAAALLLFSILILYFLNLDATQFFVFGSLLLIKSLGVFITILLLVYEIDKGNEFVKNVCQAGKQTSCKAVLGSKASKIFGITWSEAGYFYFCSTFILVLVPGLAVGDKIILLAITNCLAIPYVIFSIYYQWKVVKQWCPLCLTVQGLLILELLWSFINYWNQSVIFSLSTYDSILLSAIILLPIVFWYLLKPIFIRAKEEPIYEAAYKRLLYNPETFDQLLRQQPLAPPGYEDLGIDIGNPNAENTIIKVCNPFCGPCAKAHPVLDAIVHSNKNVKVKVIMTATNEPGDARGEVARHLLGIASKENPIQIKQALDDWYLQDTKDYSAFASRYPLNGELHKQDKKVEAMNNWCKDAEITSTPTIFINGMKLPANYKIEELKYIF